MKELIEKIEALRPSYIKNNDALERNQTIDKVIEILKSISVIQAKALRKRGTNQFYGYHAGEEKWMIMKWHPVYLGRTLKKHFVNLPPDAELVDIVIIQEGGEGC